MSEKHISRREFLSMMKTAGIMVPSAVFFSGCESATRDHIQLTPSERFSFDTWDIVEGTMIPGIQVYTSNPENIYIEDDDLVLQAVYDGETITSGRIQTRGFNTFTYGKLTIEAQLPSGHGVHPALWLRPASNDYYGKPLYAEIDILEAPGGFEGEIFANLHTQQTQEDATVDHGGSITLENPYNQFHTFGLEWSYDWLRFSVNDHTYHQIDRLSDDPYVWPFDQPFYMTMNLAMGGKWARTIAENQNLTLPDGIDYQRQDEWQFKIRSIEYQSTTSSRKHL